MKNENYILIQGWMINELNLSGNELLVYATIHGFSQDGESKFTGGLEYLMDICGIKSRHTIVNIIQKLCDLELIKKTKSDLFSKDLFETCRVQKLHDGVQKMHTTSSAKNAHLIYYNILLKINKYIILNKNKENILEILESEEKGVWDKNIIGELLDFDKSVLIALQDWLEYKKDLNKNYKSPKSILSIARILDKWLKQGSAPSNIVARSIGNGWSGIFEPKQNDIKNINITIKNKEERSF